MTNFYTETQISLQERFGRRDLAAALEQAIVKDEIDDDTAAFIGSRDFFFLSSVDAQGWPTVSYKGGAPGFVRIHGPKTLHFPSYDGNGMYLSMGNIAATARIGLLFIDFETPRRMRVQAEAALSDDPEILAAYPGAELVVRAEVAQVFVNCPRYIHPHKRLGQSRYVPDAAGDAPLPAWKRIDMTQEVLTQAERASAAEAGIITQEEYGALVQAGKA